MSRHSKNNTSLAFFTSAERAKLQYGTQTQRVGRDSMRNYDACFLCLTSARDPLCCSKGHLACKECFYENILAQKKEIARQQKLVETQKKLIAESIQQRELAAKQAEVASFEKTQSHFLPIAATSSSAESRVIDGKVYRGIKTAEGTIYLPDESKQGDSDKDMEKVYYALDKLDKEAKGRPTLPSFWLPSLTPDASPTLIEEPRTDLLCTACEPPHKIGGIKKLQKVVFLKPKKSEAKDQKVETHVCPACLKMLTNGAKLAVIRNCGHVLCKGCYGKFVKTAGQCYVCEEKCKDSDTITLFSEGTGFAGSGGKTQVSRAGIAFLN